MSDIEEGVDTPENEVITEGTDINVEKAKLSGWKPKEDFVAGGGDPAAWVEADEFNRRGELLDIIHKANQRAKNVEERLNILTEHHRKVEQAAYDRARKELLEQKMAAAEENNLKAVVEVDEQLRELEKTNTPAVAQVSAHPELDDFVARNSWYREDEDLQAYANGIGAKVERENPNMAPSQVLAIVEERVKKAFPAKFNTQQYQAPVTSVMPSRTGPTGPANARGGKKRIGYNDLPDEAKTMYNKLVKSPRNPHGVLTSEQYLKDYADISGLQYEE